MHVLGDLGRVAVLFGVAYLAAPAAALGGFLQPPGLDIHTLSRDAAAEIEAAALQARADGTSGYGTFDQIVDHSNPGLGTFHQRYWYTTQWWKGPGAPVLLVNPGEQNAEGSNLTWTTNQRITGPMAEAMGAAIIVLEHRYFGESSPYDELTIAHLQPMTVDNAMRDLVYFANNFGGIGGGHNATDPATAPWVHIGGSYSGALSGWMAHLADGFPESANGTSPFWAYYASSGVVQAVENFWTYFKVVQDAAPSNCSRDMVAVMARIDSVLQHGSAAQKAALKARFKATILEDQDFAKYVSRGPLYLQNMQFSSGTGDPVSFLGFCDYVENVWPNSTNPVPGSRGVGLSKALDGYVKWFNDFMLDVCSQSPEFPAGSPLCFQNLNASNPQYADLSVDNILNRQFLWIYCNEPIMWSFTGSPSGTTSITSRVVDVAYYKAQCAIAFPESEGGSRINHGGLVSQFNARTGGWSVPPRKTPRLVYINGEHDPWRAASVSADYRPGGPLASTASTPVFVVPGGFHCSDAYTSNWAVNAGVKTVGEQVVATIVGWVDAFYGDKGIARPL